MSLLYQTVWHERTLRQCTGPSYLQDVVCVYHMHSAPCMLPVMAAHHIVQKANWPQHAHCNTLRRIQSSACKAWCPLSSVLAISFSLNFCHVLAVRTLLSGLLHSAVLRLHGLQCFDEPIGASPLLVNAAAVPIRRSEA